jgi:citrate synthase
MAGTAELRVGDRVIELPIVEGTEGERAIDIRTLRADHHPRSGVRQHRVL